MKEKRIKGYISAKQEDLYFKESFKAEVRDKEVKFPKELGTEHPFKFEEPEKVYQSVGIINGAINKIADNIVGEFSIDTDDPNAAILINDFIKDSNFSVVVREWIREGLIKGNGFLEIDLSEGKIQTLNANNIYVKRKTNQEVTEYNQWIGDYNNFNPSSRKLITFKPNQIAHLKINGTPGEAYALGLLMPNEKAITNYVLNSSDLQKLIHRKAGAPIHVKVGQPGEAVNPTDIDNFKTLLQYMNNRTEWVTDANVDMKVIDFGQLGESLNETVRGNIRELAAGMDVPEVLWNSGQLNEGIAKVQLEGWSRKIRSYQDLIENVLIEKVFKPYLESNGMANVKLDFVWNLPSVEEVTTRLTSLMPLISSPMVSPNMKRMVELEVAKLLNIEDANKYLSHPEEGLNEEREEMAVEGNSLDNEVKKTKVGEEVKKKEEKENKERERESNLKQPEVPGVKQSCELHIHEAYDNMKVHEFINLQEIKGFNYSDYVVAILKRVKTDKFEDLAGTIEEDYNKGLLTPNEINRLRTIMKEAFRKNWTMKQIENNIRDSINLRDRITEDDRVIPASLRPEMISRTETIRLSNEGLKDLFKENNVKNIQWLTTYSDRTCEACMAMDGQIKPITEAFVSGEFGAVNNPPLHPNCRCSIISV